MKEITWSVNKAECERNSLFFVFLEYSFFVNRIYYIWTQGCDGLRYVLKLFLSLLPDEINTLHYHQGPNIGPIPNPKYPPFFPISKKKIPNLKLKKRILPGSEFN